MTLDLTAVPDQPIISASILSADFAALADACAPVIEAGAEALHIDVMDGHFVDNLTMGPDLTRCLRDRFPDTYLDVHLMVDHPDRLVGPFADAGANLLTFHAEVCPPLRPDGYDPEALLAQIHSAGLDAGMAINPATDAGALLPWLEHLQLALVMSVVPGKAGQSFMPEVLSKAEVIDAKRPDTCRLEMDGGIKPHNVQSVIDAGVDVIVAASAIFKADNPPAAVEALRG
ncbi:MAG: ribulose-phosphate 3-epimerase [Phycisphaeraceae bacterium]|nr:ribulose-phosphate 3-epimerase [Phycisphaeraceae bacterium]